MNNIYDDDCLVEKVDINQTEITQTDNASDMASGMPEGDVGNNDYSKEDVAFFRSADLGQSSEASEKVDEFNFTDGIIPCSPATLRDADGDINIKKSAVPMSPGAMHRRTFMNRTFSKLDK